MPKYLAAGRCKPGLLVRYSLVDGRKLLSHRLLFEKISPNDYQVKLQLYSPHANSYNTHGLLFLLYRALSHSCHDFFIFFKHTVEVCEASEN